jgi:hypothetical protein
LPLDFGSRTSSCNPICQLDIVPESAKFCVPRNWSHKLGVGRWKLWEQAIKCIWEKVQLATKFGLISDNIINERADPEWIRMHVKEARRGCMWTSLPAPHWQQSTHWNQCTFSTLSPQSTWCFLEEGPPLICDFYIWTTSTTLQLFW